MKRWYRGNLVKGILIVAEYVTLILAMICGIFLIDQYNKGNLLSAANIRAGAYSATEGFADTIYEMSTSIFDMLRSEDWLSTKNEDGSEKVVDMEELIQGETLTYKNESGFAYTMEDLLNWAREGRTYDQECIVVCKKGDGTYDYYFFSEFYQKIRDDQLQFVLDGDYYDDEDQATKIILENLEYGSYYEGEIMGLDGVADKKGNIQYVKIWNYSGESFDEKYKPVGAGSILEIVNENPKWNGRLKEAYQALDAALGQMNNALMVQNHVSQYSEGNTNMTYLYVDKTRKKVYTNKSEYKNYKDYKSAVKEMRKEDCHLVILPRLSECETTMDTSLQEWQSMVENWAPGMNGGVSDYIFAISVDTSYPIADTLAEYNTNYEKYAGRLIPAMVGLVLSTILFLAGLIWLTVAAGRKPEDDQLYLHPFDKLFTEIAAAGVIFIWLAGISIVICTGDTDNGIAVLMIWGAVFAVITVTMFLIGYLSLVRRIKGRLLWKKSLTRWLMGFIRKYWRIMKTKVGNICEEASRMTSSVVKMILIFGGFLIFQLFTMVLISSGAGFFFLFLLAADGAAMYYFIRRAMGRQMILDGLKRITDGELNYKIPLEKLMGEQKMAAEYINRIGEGLDAAVENSLKNERMKTELITNVSHDIKTPLTSIINYIDLLKREELPDPTVAGYLEVLESKAQRLKVLTEDVVEASKVSTGNISLEMADLNLVEMINQVVGEFQEKFDKRQLSMVVNLTEAPVVIHADGRRMWRVLENIFNNTSKYAMEGTRVYVDLQKSADQALFSLKNISAQPLNISADELTERFIRGDVSRSTEGSGLGLSIAKSLTELQGGEFELYLDGDLFKVMIVFPVV